MKSPHRFVGGALLLTMLMGMGARASALNLFECVRDLLPITEPAEFKAKRDGVEKPFVVEGKYLVFPAVKNHQMLGFYIYEGDKSWYLDAVEKITDRGAPASRQKLAALPAYENQIYRLIAQLDGLETLTLQYMPGFLVEDTTRRGPEVLAESVLPVVGVFVSRPKAHHEVYNNPETASEEDLKAWVYRRLARRPADASQVEIPQVIMRLVNQTPIRGAALEAPLREELRVRKGWIQEHNLDEDSFRQLSRLMKTTCKE